MSDSNTFSKAGRIVTLAIIAVVVMGFVYTSLNKAGGPVTETSGIVQSLGYVPSDTSPPFRLVTVRLSDGAIVQASVVDGIVVQPGQRAKMKVYRRTLSDTAAYEVVATETTK
jgi:hypothetical protein